MPLNGSGEYTPPSPQFPAVPGTIIYSDDFNTIILDMSEALSLALYADGQRVWEGDEDADGNGITNLATISADAGDLNISGQVNFSTSPTAPTPGTGDDTTKVATTEFVNNVAFAAALPAQTGNAGKFVTTDGSSASWAFLRAAHSQRTANTILGVADHDGYIEVTSGTFTQTLTAAATLGSRWRVWYKNSGTGIVTLDPNGSELIGGVTTAAMNPGDFWLIECSGTAFSLERLAGENKEVYTAGSGNFTVPAGVFRIKATLCGGGGSGLIGGGGGGGGVCVGWFNVVPGTVMAYVVGAGGAATYPASTPGAQSTFNGMTAGGGGGAVAANTVGGGTATGGTINMPGGTGTGNAGGGAVIVAFGGASALSAGTAAVNNGDIAGKYPGGGACGTTATGSAGADGILIIEYV